MWKSPSLGGLVLLALAIAGLAAVACGAKETPFAVGARGTPTATAVISVGQTPAAGTPSQRWVDREGKGIIRFAEWSDKPARLAASMMAYVVVHGFDYNVEVIALEQESAPEALLKGDVDVIAMLNRVAEKDWYDAQIAAGTILDMGPVYESRPDLRIVGSASLRLRAPELITFFGPVKPGEAQFEEQAALISSGRVGVTPIVASITYFKNNTAVWHTWMPAEVSANMDRAISTGKNTLRNRACPPHDPFGQPVNCQE